MDLQIIYSTKNNGWGLVDGVYENVINFLTPRLRLQFLSEELFGGGDVEKLLAREPWKVVTTTNMIDVKVKHMVQTSEQRDKLISYNYAVSKRRDGTIECWNITSILPASDNGTVWWITLSRDLFMSDNIENYFTRGKTQITRAHYPRYIKEDGVIKPNLYLDNPNGTMDDFSFDKSLLHEIAVEEYTFDYSNFFNKTVSDDYKAKIQNNLNRIWEVQYAVRGVSGKDEEYETSGEWTAQSYEGWKPTKIKYEWKTSLINKVAIDQQLYIWNERMNKPQLMLYNQDYTRYQRYYPCGVLPYYSVAVFDSTLFTNTDNDNYFDAIDPDKPGQYTTYKGIAASNYTNTEIIFNQNPTKNDGRFNVYFSNIPLITNKIDNYFKIQVDDKYFYNPQPSQPVGKGLVYFYFENGDTGQDVNKLWDFVNNYVSFTYTINTQYIGDFADVKDGTLATTYGVGSFLFLKTSKVELINETKQPINYFNIKPDLDINHPFKWQDEIKLYASPNSLYKIKSSTSEMIIQPEWIDNQDLTNLWYLAHTPEQWTLIIKPTTKTGFLSNQSLYQDNYYFTDTSVSYMGGDTNRYAEFLQLHGAYYNAEKANAKRTMLSDIFSGGLGLISGGIGAANSDGLSKTSFGILGLAGGRGLIGGLTRYNNEMARLNGQLQDISNTPGSINASSNLNTTILNIRKPVFQVLSLPEIYAKQIAFKSHMYGVSFPKYFYELRKLLNSRYHFNTVIAENVLPCVWPDTPEEFKSLLVDAFKNGLRIWHYRNLQTWKGVGNYDVNNVEMELIENETNA